MHVQNEACIKWPAELEKDIKIKILLHTSCFCFLFSCVSLSTCSDICDFLAIGVLIMVEVIEGKSSVTNIDKQLQNIQVNQFLVSFFKKLPVSTSLNPLCGGLI